METPLEPNPAHPLHERRDEIRRSLSRVNTASVAVVLVTIALAVTAGLSALRAGRRADLAREANRQARNDLWKSYLAQAHEGRMSGAIGRKAAGLGDSTIDFQFERKWLLETTVGACAAWRTR